MCANEGHVALILNFVCNLKKNKIPLPQHMFFVTTKELERELKGWGLNAFYDEVFDKLPTKDAGSGSSSQPIIDRETVTVTVTVTVTAIVTVTCDCD